jgi:hypothetical protein
MAIIAFIIGVVLGYQEGWFQIEGKPWFSFG